MSMLN